MRLSFGNVNDADLSRLLPGVRRPSPGAGFRMRKTVTGSSKRRVRDRPRTIDNIVAIIGKLLNIVPCCCRLTRGASCLDACGLNLHSHPENPRQLVRFLFRQADPLKAGLHRLQNLAAVVLCAFHGRPL
jgi:hypothetical protein